MKASCDAVRSNQKTESELAKTAAYVTCYALHQCGWEERMAPDEHY
jgi:hypothetical protein